MNRASLPSADDSEVDKAFVEDAGNINRSSLSHGAIVLAL